MFDFFYLPSLLRVAEKYPREVAAVAVTAIVSTQVASTLKVKIKAENELKASENRVTAARLELELAQLKLQAMPPSE